MCGKLTGLILECGEDFKEERNEDCIWAVFDTGVLDSVVFVSGNFAISVYCIGMRIVIYSLVSV